MLRKPDLFRALLIGQIMGKRRQGHFDHDAHSGIGPSSSRKSRRAKALSSEQKKRAKKNGVLLQPSRRVIDSRTGFATYLSGTD